MLWFISIRMVFLLKFYSKLNIYHILSPENFARFIFSESKAIFAYKG